MCYRIPTLDQLSLVLLTPARLGETDLAKKSRNPVPLDFKVNKKTLLMFPCLNVGVEPCHADESLAADMTGDHTCLAHALHVLPIGRVGAELLHSAHTDNDNKRL